MPDEPDETLLREQTEYYRIRGAISDDWFYRRGRYDRGTALNRQWFRESVELVQALQGFGLSGRILELGGGTGFWTQHLAASAEQITVVEISPESIAASRNRLGGFASRVRYVEADFFDWTPKERYDGVFFAFVLSHVPPERFEWFWEFVHACLLSDRKAYFMDTLRHRKSRPVDYDLPRENEHLAIRRAAGRQYHVYKSFYTPARLEERLEPLGWETDLHATREFFMYGSARYREP